MCSIARGVDLLGPCRRHPRWTVAAIARGRREGAPPPPRPRVAAFAGGAAAAAVGRRRVVVLEVVVETRRPDAANRLMPGETLKVSVGQPHRVIGEGSGPCRFLLVQGVGEHDFVAE